MEAEKRKHAFYKENNCPKNKIVKNISAQIEMKTNLFYKPHNTPFLQLMIKTIETNNDLKSMNLMQRHMRDVIDILTTVEAVTNEKMLCIQVLTNYFNRITILDNNNTRIESNINEILEYLLNDKNNTLTEYHNLQQPSFDFIDSLIQFYTSIVICYPRYTMQLCNFINFDHITLNMKKMKENTSLLDSNSYLFENLIKNYDISTISKICQSSNYLASILENIQKCSKSRQVRIATLLRDLLSTSFIYYDIKCSIFSPSTIYSLLLIPTLKESYDLKQIVSDILCSIFKPIPIGLLQPSLNYPFEKTKNNHIISIISYLSFDNLQKLHLNDILCNSADIFFEMLSKIAFKSNIYQKSGILLQFINYLITTIPHSTIFLDAVINKIKPHDIGLLISISIPSKWVSSQLEILVSIDRTKNSIILKSITHLILSIVYSISVYLSSRSIPLLISYVNGCLKRIISLHQILSFAEIDLLLTMQIVSIYVSIIQLNISAFVKYVNEIPSTCIFDLMHFFNSSNCEIIYLNFCKFIQLYLTASTDLIIPQSASFEDASFVFLIFFRNFISTTNNNVECDSFDIICNIISKKYKVDSQVIMWISATRSIPCFNDFSNFLSHLFSLYFTINTFTSLWRTLEGIKDPDSFCINTRTIISAINFILLQYSYDDFPSIILYIVICVSFHVMTNPSSLKVEFLTDLSILCNTIYSHSLKKYSQSIFVIYCILQLSHVISWISCSIGQVCIIFENLKHSLTGLKESVIRHRSYFASDENVDLFRIACLAFDPQISTKTNYSAITSIKTNLSLDDVIIGHFFCILRTFTSLHFIPDLLPPLFLDPYIKSTSLNNLLLSSRFSFITLFLFFLKSDRFTINSSLIHNIHNILKHNKQYFTNQDICLLCSQIFITRFNKTINPEWFEFVSTYPKILQSVKTCQNSLKLFSETILNISIADIAINLGSFEPLLEICIKSSDTSLINRCLSITDTDNLYQLHTHIWVLIASHRSDSLQYLALRYHKSITNIIKQSIVESSASSDFVIVLTKIYRQFPILMHLICRQFIDITFDDERIYNYTQTIPGFVYYFLNLGGLSVASRGLMEMGDLQNIQKHIKNIFKLYPCFLPTIISGILDSDEERLHKYFTRLLVKYHSVNQEVCESLKFVISQASSSILEYIMIQLESNFSELVLKISLKCAHHLMIENIYNNKTNIILIKLFFSIISIDLDIDLVRIFIDFITDVFEYKVDFKISIKHLIKMVDFMLAKDSHEMFQLASVVINKLSIKASSKFVKHCVIVLIPNMINTAVSDDSFMYLCLSFIGILNSFETSKNFNENIDLKNIRVFLYYSLSRYTATLSKKDVAIIKLFYLYSKLHFDDGFSVHKHAIPTFNFKFTHDQYISIMNGHILRDSCLIALQKLSPDMIRKSIREFPINRTFNVLQPQDIEPNLSHIYDPSFILSLISHFINKNQISKQDILFLCESSLVGFVIVSLSSLDNDSRKMSYMILQKLLISLSTVNFHLKFQLDILLNFIRNSIEKNFEIFLKINARILAEFPAIVINPGHDLFPMVSFLLYKYPLFDMKQVIFHKEFIQGFSKKFPPSEIITFFIVFIDSLSYAIDSPCDFKIISVSNLIPHVLSLLNLCSKYILFKNSIKNFISKLICNSNAHEYIYKIALDLLICDIFAIFSDDEDFLIEYCIRYTDVYYSLIINFSQRELTLFSYIIAYLSTEYRLVKLSTIFLDKIVFIVSQDFKMFVSNKCHRIADFFQNILHRLTDKRILSYCSLATIIFNFANKVDVKLFNHHFKLYSDCLLSNLDNISNPMLNSVMENIYDYLLNQITPFSTPVMCKLICNIITIHHHIYRIIHVEEDDPLMDFLIICAKILRMIIVSAFEENTCWLDKSSNSYQTVDKNHIMESISTSNVSSLIRSNAYALHDIILTLL